MQWGWDVVLSSACVSRATACSQQVLAASWRASQAQQRLTVYLCLCVCVCADAAADHPSSSVQDDRKVCRGGTQGGGSIPVKGESSGLRA